MATNPTRRLLRRRRVAERYGVCPKTISNWVKRGIFPPPFEPAPHVLGWWEHVLDEHDARRADQAAA